MINKNKKYNWIRKLTSISAAADGLCDIASSCSINYQTVYRAGGNECNQQATTIGQC